MKNLSFIIATVLLISCAGRTNQNNSDITCQEDLHAEAVKKLQDSTITSVYLGLKLGSAKDSVINHLQHMEDNGKISPLKKTTLEDNSDYRCTGLYYHGDSYYFASKINAKVDTSFHAFTTSCVVDFYNDKLYSIVVTTYPANRYVRKQHGWSAIFDMYMANYGNGYTSNTTYEYAESVEDEIRKYSSEIWNCMSYTTTNNVWTTSNVQIILATKKEKYKVDKYDENSFERLYNKYEREFRRNHRGLVYRLENEARKVESGYEYIDTHLIVYKDVNLHNELVEIERGVLEEENRIKAEQARRKEIEDSIKREQIKKEYENQSI